MALIDIILNREEVIVVETASSLGIFGADASIDFGEIKLLSQVSNRVVGEIVRFNKSNARSFTMTGETDVFYLTNEKEISFSEPIIP